MSELFKDDLARNDIQPRPFPTSRFSKLHIVRSLDCGERERLVLRRLKWLLKKHDITQQELADKMGIHRVTVARWCVGMSSPSLKDLFRISEILGEPMCVILGEDK